MPYPNYNLGIGSNSHGKQTGAVIIGKEHVLTREAPDIVLVYGNTNSTLAGALAASKLVITIAHLEAGLRSHDRQMPGEINRVITDHISYLLFTPTCHSTRNMELEGIVEGVHMLGDIMVDSLLTNLDIAKKVNHCC